MFELNSTNKLFLFAEFKTWSKDQVKRILCDENIGLGLSDEAISPLHKAGFDGRAISSIIYDLKRVGIEQTCIRFKQTFSKYYPCWSPQLHSTSFSVIHWIEETFLPTHRLLRKIEGLQGKEITREQSSKLYSEAYNTLLKKQPLKQLHADKWHDCKQQLMDLTSTPEANIRFGNPAFGEEFKLQELPLYRDGTIFAKHHLPYFSCFQHEMDKDHELLAKANGDVRNVALFIGPSGAGKTSAAIRLLCKCPGMLLTCTSYKEASSGLTTDALMQSMHGHLSGIDLDSLYGVVDQVIHNTIICRLIYILKLIENAKENPSVFEVFGGILPYLAFMQSNGKTDTSWKAFAQFTDFDLTSPTLLQLWSQEIIAEIITILNENSAKFGIESKCEKFVVVIDEASVYGRYVIIIIYITYI